MPEITLNKQINSWTRARVKDDEYVTHGEKVSVTEKEWKELQKHVTRQSGEWVRTFVLATDDRSEYAQPREPIPVTVKPLDDEEPVIEEESE